MTDRNSPHFEARNLIKENLHPTLVPCIFPRAHILSDGFPDVSYFDAFDGLPSTMSVLCKIAGLLVQALWVCVRAETKPDELIPSQLNGTLEQIWAGHVGFVEGTAISILREASLATEASPFSSMIKRDFPRERYEEFRRLSYGEHGHIRNLEEALRKIDVYALFADMVQSLPILKVCEVIDNRFCFGKWTTTTFPYLWSETTKPNNPLFLHSFAQGKEAGNIKYEDPWSTHSCPVRVADHPGLKDQYAVLRSILGLETVQLGIVYLFGEHYQYIADLAHAIAKAEGEGSKRVILELEERYHNIVATIDSKGNKITPEDFVTILIAEYGPNTIIRQALERNPISRFTEYLAYLVDKRGKGTIEEWKQLFDQTFAQKKFAIDRLISVQRSHDKACDLYKLADLDTSVAVLLRAAGLNIGHDEYYVESISDTINAIKRWQREMGDHIDDFGIRLIRALERTFRFLVCFYEGLDAYHRSFCQGQRDTSVLEAAMHKSFEASLNEICQQTPGTLIQTFRRILKQNSGRNMAENLLARMAICEANQFKNLTEGKWFSIINRIKHDKIKEGLPSRNEIADFANHSIKLLEFLKHGKAEACEGISLVPVYPAIISLQQQIRRGDGLSIYSYHVSSIERKDTIGDDIHIMTPMEYKQNEKYYCIPRANNSTSQWWLHPFMVPCRKINEILLDLPSIFESENKRDF